MASSEASEGAVDTLARLSLLRHACRRLPDGKVEAVYCLAGQPTWEGHREAVAILNEHVGALSEFLLDPRPDLEEDHALWRALLLEAARLDPHPGQRDSLYGLLHGLRCCGARLRWRRGHLLLDIRPVCEDSGWTENALRRQWLLPQLPAIRQAFAAAEARLIGGTEEVSPPEPLEDAPPRSYNTTVPVPTEAAASWSTTESETAQLAAVLRRQGWAVVESTRFGGQLILARNRRAAEQALQRYPGLPALLRCEWPGLLACESSDEVELVFAAKQHLGGFWFVPREGDDVTGWRDGPRKR